MSEQLDGVEVVWLSGVSGDERHSGSYGPDGAAWESPEGPQLEGCKGDDGQGGRVPGCPCKLQEREHPRGLP